MSKSQWYDDYYEQFMSLPRKEREAYLYLYKYNKWALSDAAQDLVLSYKKQKKHVIVCEEHELLVCQY